MTVFEEDFGKLRIVLASASPRRAALLEQAGLSFEVMPSTVEEKPIGDTPAKMVEALACQKAEDVFEKLTAGQEVSDSPLCVIGADTIVAYGDRRLGKPADEEEAVKMLMMLSGHTHQVHTGVCMMVQDQGQFREKHFAVTTEVTMYPFDQELARQYVRTGEPMDKAGAYGIQGMGAVLVSGIRGDYNNGVGLPLAEVWHALRAIITID